MHDILLMRVPAGTRRFDALPPNFEHDLGSRAAVRDAIRQRLRGVSFRDDRWGELRGEGVSIEIDVGEREPCRSVMFHISGSLAAAIPLLSAVCRDRDWAALDLQEVDFLDLHP